MRYLFRGFIRDTGRPVEGHVEADDQEMAFAALGSNGVITETVSADPKPLDLSAELPQSPEFADALESAFDSSSSQVDFDALTDRYRGKKVWVIDRDKIRRRVAQVVDAALALSAQRGEHAGLARQRVANAISGLFEDNRNIASERNADSVSGVRFNGGAGGAGSAAATPVAFNPPSYGNGNGASAAGHPGLETQIARLSNLVRQAEGTLAAVSAAARNIGSGGGGGPRRRSFSAGAKKGEEQNAVLLEIFKSNLDLLRGTQTPVPAAAEPSGESAGAAEATGGEPAAEDVAGGETPAEFTPQITPEAEPSFSEPAEPGSAADSDLSAVAEDEAGR